MPVLEASLRDHSPTRSAESHEPRADSPVPKAKKGLSFREEL